VISEDIRSYYLGKIKEAEERVASATDGEARDHWLRIIDGYRSLAGSPPRAGATLMKAGRA